MKTFVPNHDRASVVKEPKALYRSKVTDTAWFESTTSTFQNALRWFTWHSQVEKLSGFLDVDPISCEQSRKNLSVINLMRLPVEVTTCSTGGRVDIDGDRAFGIS